MSSVPVRMIAVLLAAVMSWLGLVPQAEALASPASTAACAAFTYVGNNHDAAPACSATDRGPPSTHDLDTIYDAVDRWSNGTYARPSAPTPSAAIGDDQAGLLAKVARPTPPMQEQAQVADAEFAVIEPARVAANGGSNAVRLGQAGESVVRSAFDRGGGRAG